MVEPINLKLIRKSKFACRELGDISDLRASILAKGLIEPIVVRKAEDYFEIVAGHRRYEAFKQLELNEIPCTVKNVSDKEAFEIALIENIQRETIKPLEEANAFKRYVIDFGWGGVSHLARRIGKSEEYVSHRILLLKLPEDVQNKVSGRQLNASAARELIWVNNRDLQLEIAKLAASKSLSVKQVRKTIKLVRAGAPVSAAVQQVMVDDEISADTAISAIALQKHHDTMRSKAKDIDNVILTLRMALIRIDSVISEIRTNNVKRSVQDIRYDLHQVLDKAIQTRARFGVDQYRGRHKLLD